MEYALSGELHPSELLGEQNGGRGFGQTSPDLGIEVRLKNEKAGLLCIENKLVEHSCMDIKTVLDDVQGVCHQFKWGRKYWEILESVINQEAILMLKRCPAATARYQLFRQQALCEGIIRKSRFEKVWSCVAFDERNDTLIHSLRSTGIDDFRTGWGKLFRGKAQFKTFTHQSWALWI